MKQQQKGFYFKIPLHLRKIWQVESWMLNPHNWWYVAKLVIEDLLTDSREGVATRVNLGVTISQRTEIFSLQIHILGVKKS